jgi:hypothetical protein
MITPGGCALREILAGRRSYGGCGTLSKIVEYSHEEGQQGTSEERIS